MITKKGFDEPIEWTWYYLWHHEGRRARHGASMMAPDYTHWHGMYEVADRFYVHLIPEAREIVEKASANGKKEQADRVTQVIEGILARPEHKWTAPPPDASASPTAAPSASPTAAPSVSPTAPRK